MLNEGSVCFHAAKCFGGKNLVLVLLAFHCFLSLVITRVFASVILNAEICHLQPGFSSDAYGLLTIVLHFRTFVMILLNIATGQLIKIYSYLCNSRWNADTWPALDQDFWKEPRDRCVMYVQIMRFFQSQWCGFLCVLFHSLLNHVNHILWYMIKVIEATSPCHLNALSLKQGELALVQWAIASVASRHFMIQWIWIIKHLIPPLFSREGDFKCGSGGLLWLGFLLSMREREGTC